MDEKERTQLDQLTNNVAATKRSLSSTWSIKGLEAMTVSIELVFPVLIGIWAVLALLQVTVGLNRP